MRGTSPTVGPGTFPVKGRAGSLGARRSGCDASQISSCFCCVSTLTKPGEGEWTPGHNVPHGTIGWPPYGDPSLSGSLHYLVPRGAHPCSPTCQIAQLGKETRT